MRSEADMVNMVKLFFEKQGFRVITEVPMLSKKIDIVCLDPSTQQIIAIEAKLQKWKRGFQQALTYRISSDLVYLAIHRNFSHRVDNELLQEMSVGLIVADQDGVEITFEASEHKIIHEKVRKEVVSYCGGEYSAFF